MLKNNMATLIISNHHTTQTMFVNPIICDNINWILIGKHPVTNINHTQLEIFFIPFSTTIKSPLICVNTHQNYVHHTWSLAIFTPAYLYFPHQNLVIHCWTYTCAYILICSTPEWTASRNFTIVMLVFPHLWQWQEKVPATSKISHLRQWWIID